MAKAYTRSIASVKIPVVLSFVCPKCGRHASVNRTALLSAQATVRGYNNTAASTFAQNNLAASAENQGRIIIDNLEKGNLYVLMDPSGRNVSGKTVCPHCGTRQIVDIPEKRKTLYPKVFPWIIVGLIFVIILMFALAMALSAAANGKMQIPHSLVSTVEMLCIAAVVAVIFVNRNRSRKAYSDPALMEKRYGSVLNAHMEATVILGIGNAFHVDISGRG